MTTIEPTIQNITNTQIEMLLERGEHLKLLEMVRSGEIKPERLTDLLKKNEKKHWWRYQLRRMFLGDR